MATAKIKYVGLKERETAFSVETSIVWTPGAVESVDLKHVEAMLKHPDVFALADAPQAMGLADVQPVKADETPKTIGEVPAKTDRIPADALSPDLTAMSREELHALAKARGVKVHHTSGAAKVIEALQAPHPINPA